MAAPQLPDSRPLSPHVSIWRWHATMAASIAHRISGIALYVGSALIAALIIAAASGPATYTSVMDVALSIPGKIVLLGFTGALTYHFANGIRHLVWDGPGAGFSPGAASLVSVFNFAVATAATIGIWAFGYYG